MRGYVWASVVFCAVLSGGVPASGALELYGDRAAFEARLTGANKFGFEVEEGFSLGSTVSSLSGGEIQLLGFGDAPPHISDYYVPGPVYYPPGVAAAP